VARIARSRRYDFAALMALESFDTLACQRRTASEVMVLSWWLENEGSM
jgi:hypothetical protein